MKIIGACSICGGAVGVPEHWGGTTPPMPTCQCCGATAANPSGIVIPMVPKRRMEPLSIQEIQRDIQDEKARETQWHLGNPQL